MSRTRIDGRGGGGGGRGGGGGVGGGGSSVSVPLRYCLRLLVIVAIHFLPDCTVTGICSQSNSGVSFIVVFTQSPQSDGKSLALFAGSAGNAVSVTASAPNFSPTSTTIPPNGTVKINIPSQFELGSAGSSSILLTGNDSFSVVGLTEQGSYSEAYLALPLNALGKRYYVVTYASLQGTGTTTTPLSQFAIVAVDDGTVVDVTLSKMFTGVLQFRSVNYGPGDRISIRLNKMETVQLQSTSELTGTEVVSTNRIAVWAGNQAAVLDAQTQNYVVEQMIPVEPVRSPVNYIVSPLPGGRAYVVKVVAAFPNTDVGIVSQGSDPNVPFIERRTLLSSGDYTTLYQSEKGLVIWVSEPVVVCQLTNSSSSPAMTVVPPATRLLSQYRYVVPTSTSHNFSVFTTLVTTNSSALQYDAYSFNLASIVWDRVPGSSYEAASLGTSTNVNLIHLVESKSDNSFLEAFVYGRWQAASGVSPITYFYPAGLCLDGFGLPSATTAASTTATPGTVTQSLMTAVTPARTSASDVTSISSASSNSPRPTPTRTTSPSLLEISVSSQPSTPRPTPTRTSSSSSTTFPLPSVSTASSGQPVTSSTNSAVASESPASSSSMTPRPTPTRTSSSSSTTFPPPSVSTPPSTSGSPASSSTTTPRPTPTRTSSTSTTTFPLPSVSTPPPSSSITPRPTPTRSSTSSSSTGVTTLFSAPSTSGSLTTNIPTASSTSSSILPSPSTALPSTTSLPNLSGSSTTTFPTGLGSSTILPSSLSSLSGSSATSLPIVAVSSTTGFTSISGSSATAFPSGSESSTTILPSSGLSTTTFPIAPGSSTTGLASGSSSTIMPASGLSTTTLPIAPGSSTTGLASGSSTTIMPASGLSTTTLPIASGSSITGLASGSSTTIMPASGLSTTTLPIASGSSITGLASGSSTTIMPASGLSTTTLPTASGSSITGLASGSSTTIMPASGLSTTTLPIASGSSITGLASGSSTTIMPASGLSTTTLPIASGSSITGLASGSSTTIMPASGLSTTTLPIASGSSITGLASGSSTTIMPASGLSTTTLPIASSSSITGLASGSSSTFMPASGLSTTTLPIASSSSITGLASGSSTTIMPASGLSTTTLPIASGSSATGLASVSGSSTTIIPASGLSTTTLPIASGSSTTGLASGSSTTIIPASGLSTTTLPIASGSSATGLASVSGSSTTIIPASGLSTTTLPIASGSSTTGLASGSSTTIIPASGLSTTNLPIASGSSITGLASVSGSSATSLPSGSGFSTTILPPSGSSATSFPVVSGSSTSGLPSVFGSSTTMLSSGSGLDLSSTTLPSASLGSSSISLASGSSTNVLGSSSGSLATAFSTGLGSTNLPSASPSASVSSLPTVSGPSTSVLASLSDSSTTLPTLFGSSPTFTTATVSSGSAISGTTFPSAASVPVSSPSIVTSFPTVPNTATSGSSPGVPTFGNTYSVPVNRATGPGQMLEVDMVNASPTPVQVVITFLGTVYDLIIPANGNSSWTVANPTSGPDVVTAIINASAPIFVTTLQRGSCSAYLTLPDSALGTEYQIITWNSASYFTISASDRPTRVSVRFPAAAAGASCRVTSDNVTFFCGDDFKVNLDPGSAMMFSSSVDLSGTYVRSSDAPVSIVAGNPSSTKIGSGSEVFADSTASELFPVYAWGVEFAVPPAPNNDGVGFFLRIGSGIQWASVTVTSASRPGGSRYLVRPDECLSLEFADNRPLLIAANVSIQVLQFVKGAPVGGPGAARGAPAALTIPATERFAGGYAFGLVPSFSNFVTVIAERSAVDGLRLNGGQLPPETGASTWQDVGPAGSRWVVRTLELQGTAYGTLSHPTANFGAFRYSYSFDLAANSSCELAYPAGAMFPAQAPVVATTTLPYRSTTIITPSSATVVLTNVTPPMAMELLVKDCTCLNVSTQLQPSYNGYYYAINQTLNGQRVYKRLDCELYLFAYNGSASYWIYGPSLGMNRGMLLNSAIYQPAEGVVRWEGYNSTSGTFQEEPNYSGYCSCPATSCASVEFLNSTTQSSIFDGVFVYHRTTFNGRPVFKHQDLSLYLYYYIASACQRWMVGSRLGSDVGVLYTDNNGTSVNDISAAATDWRLFKSAGSGFVSQPSISIACYQATSGSPS